MPFEKRTGWPFWQQIPRYLANSLSFPRSSIRTCSFPCYLLSVFYFFQRRLSNGHQQGRLWPPAVGNRLLLYRQIHGRKWIERKLISWWQRWIQSFILFYSHHRTVITVSLPRILLTSSHSFSLSLFLVSLLTKNIIISRWLDRWRSRASSLPNDWVLFL